MFIISCLILVSISNECSYTVDPILTWKARRHQIACPGVTFSNLPHPKSPPPPESENVFKFPGGI